MNRPPDTQTYIRSDRSPPRENGEEYCAETDLWGSVLACYEAIRLRKANGGPGWPK